VSVFVFFCEQSKKIEHLQQPRQQRHKSRALALKDG
jgi:hypothetical protein